MSIKRWSIGIFDHKVVRELHKVVYRQHYNRAIISGFALNIVVLVARTLLSISPLACA